MRCLSSSEVPFQSSTLQQRLGHRKDIESNTKVIEESRGESQIRYSVRSKICTTLLFTNLVVDLTSSPFMAFNSAARISNNSLAMRPTSLSSPLNKMAFSKTSFVSSSNDAQQCQNSLGFPALLDQQHP